MKSVILVVLLMFISINFLQSQNFHFEQKPFLPLTDTGKYKLSLLAGYGTSRDFNFHSSITLTRNLYIFYGSNSQNGNREWKPILGDLQTVELKNNGNYGGLGIIFLNENFFYNLAFGLEKYKINNNIYFTSHVNKLPRENTQASYKNYFLELKLCKYSKKRISIGWPTRVSFVDYDYLKFTNIGQTYDTNENFEKINLQALWLDSGLLGNFNWEVFNLFYQMGLSLPIKSLEYKNNDIKGLRFTMNFGLNVIFDFKHMK